MIKFVHEKNTTHFGFTEVPIHEKSRRVADVFHSVAAEYDKMNDLMSMGMHRLWKQFTVAESGVREGQQVLDVACGTGDLSIAFSQKVGKTGLVVMSDINEKMLQYGRNRLIDQGIIDNVAYLQADAESLPFHDNQFDCLTIGFGLRNVTDKQRALHSMYRVLKPGGKVLILEFSKPVIPGLTKMYDRFSFKVIPKLGKVVANDESSYQYLIESIRMHPDQETLKKMMETARFEDVDYFNLSGGIVALHKGFKY